jgi:hypothetical protein
VHDIKGENWQLRTPATITESDWLAWPVAV